LPGATILEYIEGTAVSSPALLRSYRLDDLLPSNRDTSEWREALESHHAVGFNGYGQTIAVIDTGYDTLNPYLAGATIVDKCLDLTGEGIEDRNGHGTLVSCEPTTHR